MATRRVSRRSLTKNQLGDLKERIEIGSIVLRPGSFGNAGMVRRFTAENEVWAKCETLRRITDERVIFNGVNIASQDATHAITMRYRDDFTTEKWIKWRGEAYRVENVLDPEERHQYTVAFCYLEGEEDREANT